MPRRDTDPFASFRFRLELNDVQVAGFAECTGLQMEVKVFEYKEGGRNESTLKFPEHAAYGNITLKRGMTNSTDLLDWQLDVVNGEFSINKRTSPNSVAILLLDEKAAQPDTVQRWNLVRPIPVKWSGPDLKAASSEVAIETLEIAHEGITKG